jgi:branched-subunit amino acid transport protein AzlD
LVRLRLTTCRRTPPPNTAVDQRLARVSALAAIATIFAAVADSRQSGFAAYAALFVVPYVIFALARSSQKWQAWGTALAWGMIALSLAATAFPTFHILRGAHRSQIEALVVLIALLLTQVAQLIFVRRAIPGKIAFGRRLFRTLLYYACSLLVVAATLPNWYVPPVVRRENQAMESLHEYSEAMQAYAKMSNDGSYPPRLSALATSNNARKLAFSAVDSELLCEQVSCIRNGYRFQYRPIFHEKRVVSYTISARPVEFEESGRHSFLLTSEGRICWTREDREAVLTDSNR